MMRAAQRAGRLIDIPGSAEGTLAALFLVIYALDCGHGFIADDFAWIEHGRLDGASAMPRIVGTAQGFYRPLVSLSFGLNHAASGLAPLAYGWTNLLLALAIAAALRSCALGLGLGRGAATTAAAIWLFNWHGINASVLWLSGRTSLLLTLWALLAALALLRGRPVWAGLATLMALLSKEEAVLLPLLLTVWVLVGRRGVGGVASGPVPLQLWAVWVSLVTYLGLRAGSNAITPWSAPAYYQPVFDAGHLLRNVVEYLDRSSTVALAAVLAAWAAARSRPEPSAAGRRAVALGIAWAAAGFGLTVFLPVRSSLYAVFPSAGVALAAAAVIEGARRAAPHRARRGAVWSLLLVVVLVPVYWQRNIRWVELADLSAAVLRQFGAIVPTLPAGSHVVLVDDDRHHANLTNAWAGLVPEVARVALFDRVTLEVVPASGSVEPDRGDAIWFRLDVPAGHAAAATLIRVR
jgi:hypothetical protein